MGHPNKKTPFSNCGILAIARREMASEVMRDGDDRVAVPGHRRGKLFRGAYTATATLAVASLSHPAHAGIPSHCIAALILNNGDNSHYKEREDHRCEGRFTEPKSRRALQVVSLASGSAHLSGSANLLTWSATDSTIRIRATVISRRVHYQMDQQVAQGVNSYAWPTDVLGTLGKLSKDERLVLLAWRSSPGEGGTTDYAPIRLNSATDPLMLGIVATVPLKDYALSITKLPARNVPDIQLPSKRLARMTLVEIALPELSAGRYRIEITGHSSIESTESTEGPITAEPFYVLVP